MEEAHVIADSFALDRGSRFLPFGSPLPTNVFVAAPSSSTWSFGRVLKQRMSSLEREKQELKKKNRALKKEKEEAKKKTELLEMRREELERELLKRIEEQGKLRVEDLEEQNENLRAERNCLKDGLAAMLAQLENAIILPDDINA